MLDITPKTVSIGGVMVIDAEGKWVGDGGLRGLQVKMGRQVNADLKVRQVGRGCGTSRASGQDGAQGAVGADGSPDTPAQVLGKIVQVDGAGSTLESDLIDPRFHPVHALRRRHSKHWQCDHCCKMTSDSVLTKSIRIMYATRLVFKWFATKNDDNDILGVQRFLFNDPGPDGRLEWAGSAARIYVAPQDDGNQDGLLRLQNTANGISLEGPVRTSTTLTTEGRVRALSGATITEATINDQEALVLGNGVNAVDVGNKPSAVLGFAGNGVAHAAMGWYPNSGVFELYDTSVGLQRCP